MSNSDNIERQVRELVVRLREEIDKHKKGCGATSNQAQLARFCAHFELLLEQRRSNTRMTDFGMRWIVSDSWPFDSALGGDVIEVERALLGL